MAWKTIVGVLSLAATIIGLVQAFSFDHLQTLRCEIGFPNQEAGRVIDCLRALEASEGSVVMLDWQSYVGDEIPNSEGHRYPFHRIDEDGGISLYLDEEDIQPALAARHLTLEDVRREAIFQEAVAVNIAGSGQMANPYSILSPMLEGVQDSAGGPYQVTMQLSDMWLIYRLSPAPMTDSLPSQVRCARRNWPQALKFVLCPFI